MAQKSLEGGEALGIVEQAVGQALEKLVQEKDGSIKVDWKQFNELDRQNDDDLGRMVYSAAVDKLEKLKILSFGENNNYELMGCDVVLNPSSYVCKLYFTREQDAKAYKEAAYKNAQYYVKIRKIKVIE